MRDLSLTPGAGPTPGPAPGPAAARAGYLAMVRRKRTYGAALGLVCALVLASGWTLADARNAGGFWAGLPHVFDFPAEILAEAWRDRAALPGLAARFLPSLVETVNIAAVATLLGGLGGATLALLGARGLAPWPRAVWAVRRMMDLLRAVPEIVVALVLIYVLGGGPVPAAVAIALHTCGALGELFSEAAENVDDKPVTGLASVGAGWGQRMWLGVIPQVAPNWLSYWLLRLEINVRASAILGFVGAGGIGFDLKIAMQWGQGRYDEVVAIFLLLFLTIFVIDQASDRARDAITKGR